MNLTNLHYKSFNYSLHKFFEQYEHIAKNEPHHVLLESGRGGRYSILGLRPFALLEGKNHKLTIEVDGKTDTFHGDPLQLMKEWMAQFKTETKADIPDFQGGAIGFISYDYARYIERLPELAKDNLLIPELYFLVFNEWFVYDHLEEKLWIFVRGKEDASSSLLEWEQVWTNSIQNEVSNIKKSYSKQERSFSLSEHDFMKATEKIQQYISQGDVFQVNLAVRQSEPLHVHALEVYKKLRVLNPSPYMGYLQTPGFQIVSASPELLVKKQGDVVSTRPIAGTRSRGANEAEDQKLANELIQNEKERAEHVMLVDLERNDLGRVCEYGSVHVDEFMVIEKYSHVMHIVSNVKGVLAKEKDGYDLIKAAFPGGTITGAPKVRTMEIIEELEPVRRGIYTGSIGWIGFDGNLELNIVIRTMIVQDGVAHVQAGAGIVIDSHPQYEYKESLKKALALWKAKELAEEGEQHDIND